MKEHPELFASRALRRLLAGGLLVLISVLWLGAGSVFYRLSASSSAVEVHSIEHHGSSTEEIRKLLDLEQAPKESDSL